MLLLLFLLIINAFCMENAKNQLNFPLKFSGNLNIITSIKSQVYFNLFI